jgi:hypothetical protein
MQVQDRKFSSALQLFPVGHLPLGLILFGSNWLFKVSLHNNNCIDGSAARKRALWLPQ